MSLWSGRGGVAIVPATEYNPRMSEPQDRPLPPEPVFRAALKALISLPKSALTEAEKRRVKRPRRRKPA
jgi:hypothetical protein